MQDFVILYEHRNREIENASLLAAELEDRGYTVKIRCIYSLKKYFTRTKVLIVPHLYNNDQVIGFCKNFWMDNKKIISLQYEQILTKMQRDGIHNPTGQAVFAQHTAWGQAQKDVYLSHGIEERNTSIVGHIAMDLMRSDFDEFYLSRNQISEEFGLDNSKQWILFISTFAYKMMTENEVKAYHEIDAGAKMRMQLSLNAQKAIVGWLKKISEENKNIIVIYRRHPSEREDPELLELEEKISNFRCIDSYSMRQWVRVSDKLYTWYSTSIADAYYGNKMCYILRPEKLPDEHEVEIMAGADFIKTFEDFKATIENNDCEIPFPISDSTMEYFYSSKNREKNDFAFLRVADLCEKVVKEKEYEHEYDFGKSRWNMFNYESKIMIFNSFLCCVLFEICAKIKIFVPLRLQEKKVLNRIIMYEREAYKIDRDIRKNKNKFADIIHKIHINMRKAEI